MSGPQKHFLRNQPLYTFSNDQNLNEEVDPEYFENE